ncbi:MAG: NAD(P)H-dependent oxidoreductase [Pseudomonadota bacterium]
MTILHIDSSITGDNSASRAISAAVVDRLRAEQPGVAVEYRDLAAEPVAHLTLAALGGENADLAQFLAADTIVIGAAMYNFGVPSQLKAWLDRILIAGQTFRYTATGPEGLVGDKRVILAVARGGLYGADQPGAALEHVETYLRGVFGFIGVSDPEVIVAEGLAIGPEQREAAVSAALVEARGLALAA